MELDRVNESFKGKVNEEFIEAKERCVSVKKEKLRGD